MKVTAGPSSLTTAPVFIDQMPCTATGKIQKNVLREQYHGHFQG